MGLLLIGTPSTHQQGPGVAGLGQGTPSPQGARHSRATQGKLTQLQPAPRMCSRAARCMLCSLPPPAPRTHLSHLPLSAPCSQGRRAAKGVCGGGEWLEKQKGNEVLHFFCYGFEGNLGPTSCFLELTVLKSSICLVKCALKYSGHSKNVNSVTGKKAHRKHVYQQQKHLQSQVTSSFNPRYIILVVSSLS